MNMRSNTAFPCVPYGRRRPHRRRQARKAELIEALASAQDGRAAEHPDPAVDGAAPAALQSSPWNSDVITRLIREPGLRVEMRSGTVCFEFGD